jgi:hypothetical protein
MLETNGNIRFVQVTVAQEHDLKLAGFVAFVESLPTSYLVKSAEIFFVIPDWCGAAGFKIPNIYDNDGFAHVIPGWPKTDGRLRQRIQIVTLSVKLL